MRVERGTAFLLPIAEPKPGAMSAWQCLHRSAWLRISSLQYGHCPVVLSVSALAPPHVVEGMLRTLVSGCGRQTARGRDRLLIRGWQYGMASPPHAVVKAGYARPTLLGVGRSTR